MEYRLQSMYNHMVGRTASIISPFYSLLPDSALDIVIFNGNFNDLAKKITVAGNREYKGTDSINSIQYVSEDYRREDYL